MDEQQPQPQPAPQAPQPPRARRSCLFYGCLSGFVLALLLLLGVALGLRRLFTDFTDTKPTTFPPPRLSATEIDQLRKRVDSFRETVRGGTATAPLSLTADEIDALIVNDPDLRALRNRFWVTKLEGDKIFGQLSVLMEDVGIQKFKGRYLNASGMFTLSVRNGVIRLTAEELAGKGRPLPKFYMEHIRTQNLAQSLKSNPRVLVAMDWIQSVAVKDGKLVITPNQKPPQ
jgi:hypothetical protein